VAGCLGPRPRDCVLLAAGTLGLIVWTWQAYAERTAAPDLFVLAVAGGLLVGAAPSAAGSAFAFVAIVTAGFRLEFPQALAVTALGLFTLALGALVYNQAAVGVLAYGLGIIASLLAGPNGRQAVRRAEEAELLLAQTQRSREEQLRAARLEESAPSDRKSWGACGERMRWRARAWRRRAAPSGCCAAKAWPCQRRWRRWSPSIRHRRRPPPHRWRSMATRRSWRDLSRLPSFASPRRP